MFSIPGLLASGASALVGGLLGSNGSYDGKVPGLEQYQSNMNNSGMWKALQQAMGGVGQTAQMPALDPEYQRLLEEQYRNTMNWGQQMIGQNYTQNLGKIGSDSATRGMRNSTGHGRAVGGAMQGAGNQMLQLHTEGANAYNTAMNQGRRDLLGADTQRMGINYGLLAQALGLPLQGMGIGLQGQQIANQGNANIGGALAGMGMAIPSIYGMFSGGGQQASNPYIPQSPQYNTNPTLNWNLTG